VLRKGQRGRKRKADSDVDEYSDDEVLEVLRRVHQQMEMVITGTHYLVVVILVAYRAIDEPPTEHWRPRGLCTYALGCGRVRERWSARMKAPETGPDKPKARQEGHE
jgi:hypothetical protein